MGLVTKNAILLVDFALSGIEAGKPQFQAMIDSGVSRLRPIIMTSVSTIAGMLPIALAGNSRTDGNCCYWGFYHFHPVNFGGCAGNLYLYR